MSLPSVSVQVSGGLTVVSNLAVFGERLKGFIENLNPNPSDDQAFANAENEIKVLKEAEAALQRFIDLSGAPPAAAVPAVARRGIAMHGRLSLRPPSAMLR